MTKQKDIWYKEKNYATCEFSDGIKVTVMYSEIMFDIPEKEWDKLLDGEPIIYKSKNQGYSLESYKFDVLDFNKN